MPSEYAYSKQAVVVVVVYLAVFHLRRFSTHQIRICVFPGSGPMGPWYGGWPEIGLQPLTTGFALAPLCRQLPHLKCGQCRDFAYYIRQH